MADYKGKQMPLQERIELLERDLQRERDNRDNIQADYNQLCQKVGKFSLIFYYFSDLE